MQGRARSRNRGDLLALACCGVLFATAAPAALRSEWVPSTANASTFPLVVALPPSAHATNPAPALILLHGAGCDERTWGQLVDLAALARSTGRAILCPTAGAFSWYVDAPVPGGVQAETFLIHELLPWVDRHLPVRSGDRWIAGFSMGGYGALRLALRHPDRFTAAVALSPCIQPSQWQARWHLREAMGRAGERGLFDLFHDAEILALARRQRPALAIGCGQWDFFHPEARRAHLRLQAAGVAHAWIPVPGGHTGDVWQRLLPELLRRLEPDDGDALKPQLSTRPDRTME